MADQKKPAGDNCCETDALIKLTLKPDGVILPALTEDVHYYRYNQNISMREAQKWSSCAACIFGGFQDQTG